MDKLQEIKDKFEDRTVDGHEVEILTYKEGQKYSIIGIKLVDSNWFAFSWTKNGLFDALCPRSGQNLIPKKKHLPKDILCEVWDSEIREGRKSRRYSNGEGEFYQNGATSTSSGDKAHTTSWDNYKVLKQDPVPWFNDSEECPIPEGLEYQVWVAGDWRKRDDWNWKPKREASITAYQILGEIE